MRTVSLVYRERGGRVEVVVGWGVAGQERGGVVRQRGDGGWGKKNRLDRFAFTPDVLLESGGRAGRERQHLAAAAGSHLVLLTA